MNPSVAGINFFASYAEDARKTLSFHVGIVKKAEVFKKEQVGNR